METSSPFKKPMVSIERNRKRLPSNGLLSSRPLKVSPDDLKLKKSIDKALRDDSQELNEHKKAISMINHSIHQRKDVEAEENIQMYDGLKSINIGTSFYKKETSNFQKLKLTKESMIIFDFKVNIKDILSLERTVDPSKNRLYNGCFIRLRPETTVLHRRIGRHVVDKLYILFATKDSAQFEDFLDHLKKLGIECASVDISKHRKELEDSGNQKTSNPHVLEIKPDSFYGNGVGTSNTIVHKKILRSNTANNLQPESTDIMGAETEPTIRRNRINRAHSVESAYESIAPNEQIYFEPDLTYRFKDKKTFHISNKDFQCLYNSNWFNDNILDFFLKYDLMVNHEANNINANSVELLNSFFFTKLLSGSENDDYYNCVKSWFKNSNDLFDKQFVIIPIMHDFHWFVVVITGLPRMKQMLENEAEKEIQETESQGAHAEEDEMEITDNGNASLNDTIDESFTNQEDDSVLEDKDPQIGSESSEKLVSLEKSKSGPTPVVKINILDSLERNQTNVVNIIKSFLRSFAKEKYGYDLPNGRLYKTYKRVALQSNSNDCGLHVFWNINKLYTDPEEFYSIVFTNRKKGGSIKRPKESRYFAFPIAEREKYRKNLREVLIKLLKAQVKANGGDETLVGSKTMDMVSDINAKDKLSSDVIQAGNDGQQDDEEEDEEVQFLYSNDPNSLSMSTESNVDKSTQEKNCITNDDIVEKKTTDEDSNKNGNINLSSDDFNAESKDIKGMDLSNATTTDTKQDLGTIVSQDSDMAGFTESSRSGVEESLLKNVSKFSGYDDTISRILKHKSTVHGVKKPNISSNVYGFDSEIDSDGESNVNENGSETNKRRQIVDIDSDDEQSLKSVQSIEKIDDDDEGEDMKDLTERKKIVASMLSIRANEKAKDSESDKDNYEDNYRIDMNENKEIVKNLKKRKYY